MIRRLARSICRIALRAFGSMRCLVRARNLLSSFGIVALLAMGQALALGEDEYLLPEDAFKYTATADEQKIGRAHV